MVGPQVSDQSSNSSRKHYLNLGKKFDYRRIYSALVFIPLFYLFTRYFPPIVFFLLILLSVILALWEFYRLHFNELHCRKNLLVGFMGAALLLFSLQWPTRLNLQTALITILLMMVCYQIIVTSSLSISFKSLTVLFFGIIYIILCYTSL